MDKKVRIIPRKTIDIDEFKVINDLDIVINDIRNTSLDIDRDTIMHNLQQIENKLYDIKIELLKHNSKYLKD